MTEKIEIVEQLGEQGILLPGLVGKALQANDRIKLRFSLLQEAIAQTRNPRQNPPTFTTERHAAGLGDMLFDATISGARALVGNEALVPGSKELLSGLRTDLATMLAPIETADPASAQSFSNRLTALSKSIPMPDGDTISSSDIPPMTSARRKTSDSVHLLVMDMHQAINRLAAATALRRARRQTRDQSLHEWHQSHESSCVWAYDGRATRLTIQNDIGTTDAHVLVVHVEHQNVTVTYTDVHRPRAKFFISLFAGEKVTWAPVTEREA